MDTKPTVGNVTAGLFIGIAALLDLLKFLLLFVNAIPVLGTVLDVLGSLGISFIEIFVVFGGLWLVGAYRAKGSGATNMLLTMAASAIDLVPIVDDLPATTAAVIGIIVKSRIQDKVNAREQQKQMAAAAHRQAEQEAKYEAAQAAAIRVQSRNAT